MGKHRKNPNRPAPTYSVGYRVPPSRHQFPPGTSGRSKGQVRKPKTVYHEVDELLMELVSVQEKNGKMRRMTRQSVILRAIMRKAMTGDRSATAFLFNLRETHRDSPQTVIDSDRLSREDRSMMADYLARIQEEDPPDSDVPLEGRSDA